MSGHSGRGLAKAILVGEHAVVYGAPALSVALDRGVRVTVEDRAAAAREAALAAPVEEALRRIAEALGADLSRLRVVIDSEVPHGAGLGASAALCVGFARALLARKGRSAPPHAEVVALAGLGEAVLHGNPSGIDAEVAAGGGIVRFLRGEPPVVERIEVKEPLPLVVADTGAPAPTREMVERVAARRKTAPGATDALFDLAGALVEAAVPAVRSADWPALGRMLDAAHAVLQRLGVSTPDLDRGVRAARRAGALGAKLTGAGGGGCLIALAPRPEPVLEALAGEGMAAFSLLAGRPP